MSALSEFIVKNSIKGFLAEDEGDALFEYAKTIAHVGPCLEIGSYCGKSSVYLGEACKQTNNTLYAVDHHRGSEEHQKGEEYHDASLYDDKQACVDSFPVFRNTLKMAKLEDVVVPVVATSVITVKHWGTPLGMVFIDGGHSHAMAMDDCSHWSQKIASGGILAVHDLFEKPEEGGQGPYLAFQAVLEGGEFEFVEKVRSLGFLRRK